MKATELRIGNYVNWDGVKTKFSLEHFQDIKLYPNESRKYSPIPLTEEWLIDFGYIYFDKGGYKSYSLIIDYVCVYNITFSDDNGFVFSNRYKPVKLLYVHQLQNLYFALTNEELTLK